jgi:hypothetical protein
LNLIEPKNKIKSGQVVKKRQVQAGLKDEGRIKKEELRIKKREGCPCCQSCSSCQRRRLKAAANCSEAFQIAANRGQSRWGVSERTKEELRNMMDENKRSKLPFKS